MLLHYVRPPLVSKHFETKSIFFSLDSIVSILENNHPIFHSRVGDFASSSDRRYETGDLGRYLLQIIFSKWQIFKIRIKILGKLLSFTLTYA